MSEVELIPLVEAAPALGVTPDALRKALQRARRPVFKQGRLSATRLADLEWYAAKREHRAPSAAHRPKGWWGLYRVMEALSVTEDTVTQLQKRGELSAVVVGRLYFYDPESVRACRLRRETIPPGWVSIASLIRAHGWPDDVPYGTARRMGLETRTYHQSGKVGRNALKCIRRDDAPRLVMRMNAPNSFAGRVTSRGLAAILGIRPHCINDWTKRDVPFIKCRRGWAWFDPAEVLRWLEGRVTPQHGVLITAHIAALRAHLAQQQEVA